MANHTTRTETRLMPLPVELGQHFSAGVGEPMLNWKNSEFLLAGGRNVMGFNLPTWQRPFVWTKKQSVSFIESLWSGLNVGTYTFNRCHEDPEYDNILIDGQQRMKALQDYLTDTFKVHGYYWSEVTLVDVRAFRYRSFPCYITHSTDDAYLRDYYNKMNFGGTAHTEDQKAEL